MVRAGRASRVCEDGAVRATRELGEELLGSMCADSLWLNYYYPPPELPAAAANATVTVAFDFTRRPDFVLHQMMFLLLGLTAVAARRQRDTSGGRLQAPKAATAGGKVGGDVCPLQVCTAAEDRSNCSIVIRSGEERRSCARNRRDRWIVIVRQMVGDSTLHDSHTHYLSTFLSISIYRSIFTGGSNSLIVHGTAAEAGADGESKPPGDDHTD